MVGKSDFNENPVVSLDLDLDFGLGLRVCQYKSYRALTVKLFEIISTLKMSIDSIMLKRIERFGGKIRILVLRS